MSRGDGSEPFPRSKYDVCLARADVLVKIIRRSIAMRKTGFIGTGRMGSVLIRAFVKTDALHKDQVLATDEEEEKVRILESELKIQTTKDDISVAKDSETIFLCVEPSCVETVLGRIKPYLTSNELFISIAAGVTIHDIESKVDARVVRVIPSIIAEAATIDPQKKIKGGVSLVCFGARATDEDEKLVMEELFGKISEPIKLKEKDFPAYTYLTSCGPAFIAYIMKYIAEKFADAGSTKSNGRVSSQRAAYLVKQTMLGTMRLLTAKDMEFEQIYQRVMTPGGITEEGIQVLKEELKKLANIFDKVMNATDLKRKKLKADLEKS